MSRPKKQQADCRADTMSDGFAGIPRTVLKSPAYRDLSPIARCVLIELVSEMNGYNNGSIAASHREMRERIGCSPRLIVKAFADLFDHGFVDVAVEGTWKTKLARQYRLTFVSTKGGRASNDYSHWNPPITKSGATDAVAVRGLSVTASVAEARKPVTAWVAAIGVNRRKTAIPEVLSATDAVTLIDKPYRVGETPGTEHQLAPLEDLPTAATSRSMCETDRCEGCRDEVNRIGTRGKPKRFCSERCRKRAEVKRAKDRANGTTATMDHASPSSCTSDRPAEPDHHAGHQSPPASTADTAPPPKNNEMKDARWG